MIDHSLFQCVISLGRISHQLNLQRIFRFPWGYILLFLRYVWPYLKHYHHQAKISIGTYEIAKSTRYNAMKFTHLWSPEDEPAGLEQENHQSPKGSSACFQGSLMVSFFSHIFGDDVWWYSDCGKWIKIRIYISKFRSYFVTVWE